MRNRLFWPWFLPVVLVFLLPPRAGSAPFDIHTPSAGSGKSPTGRSQLRALADFEPADGVLLAWDDDLADVVAGIARVTAETATPFLLVEDADERSYVETYLEGSDVDLARVRFIELEYDSAWTRDYGPAPVVRHDGSVAFVDSRYMEDRPLDERIPTELGEALEVEVLQSDIELPGGNFITNGAGLCLLTDQIEEDNPEFEDHELAFHLWRSFGCESIAIVERLIGEDTGHVDMFAAFTGPDTVLVGEYDLAADPENAEVLERNAGFLEDLTLRSGRRLSVIRIPMPSNHDEIFRSYTNSLIVNGTVVMPIYTDAREQEQAALEAYARALPVGFRIVTVDAGAAIALGGALHCLARTFTHQPTRIEAMLRELRADIEAIAPLFVLR